jgi:hypothetical protein
MFYFTTFVVSEVNKEIKIFSIGAVFAIMAGLVH